jgi:hypothetical protein
MGRVQIDRHSGFAVDAQGYLTPIGDTIVQFDDAWTTSYYVYDGFGTVRQLTNPGADHR